MEGENYRGVDIVVGVNAFDGVWSYDFRNDDNFGNGIVKKSGCNKLDRD